MRSPTLIASWQLPRRSSRLPILGRSVPKFNRPDLREVIVRSCRIVYLRQDGAVFMLESCMLHEIFSCSSAENLGILEAKGPMPWRLGYSFTVTLGKESYR